ncbi:MAG TPA: hypothetical protein VJM46_05340 [Candidatus Saccharimonadales bacterium]|nr:hypothetical protein [Candidatus Saccharimonadales bacterium]
MPSTRSNEQLLDLMLLGMTWVQEATGNYVGVTGNGVLQTMKAAGALSDQQYRLLAAGDPGLRAFLVPLTHLEYGRVFSQAKLRQTCGRVDKPLLGMVNTGMFFGDKLFAPRGYKMLATEVGQRRALAAAQRYADVVTRSSFSNEWARHRRQMRGMHATLTER